MVLAAALAGCSDGPEVAPGAVVTEVATRWALESVDGRGLPTRQQVTFEAAAEVVSARLSVASDGTWLYRYDQQAEDNGHPVVTSGGATGTYEPMSSDPVTLRMLDGESQETFIATYKQGVLEVVMRGQLLRFARIP